MDLHWGYTVFIWKANDSFYISKWQERRKGRVRRDSVRWGLTCGRKALIRLLTNLSPHHVRSWHFPGVRRGWPSDKRLNECVISWTHTHIITLRQCHRARHEAQTVSLANASLISLLLLLGLLSTSRRCLSPESVTEWLRTAFREQYRPDSTYLLQLQPRETE